MREGKGILVRPRQAQHKRSALPSEPTPNTDATRKEPLSLIGRYLHLFNALFKVFVGGWLVG